MIKGWMKFIGYYKAFFEKKKKKKKSLSDTIFSFVFDIKNIYLIYPYIF